MDTKTLWQIVLADLELQVSKAVFQTFLSQTKLLALTDKEAIIGCEQPMAVSFLEKRYSLVIKKILDHYTKTDNQLVFKAVVHSTATLTQKPEGPLFNTPLPKPVFNNYSSEYIRLNPNYTFANFAVSSSNQMAHAAATAVAKNPGTSYNPLFLYGGVGVGKTHLMQAIAHGVLKEKPQAKIIYTTGEEFTNEIIEAISTKTTVAFKKKFRRLQVLMVDDIQFIAGKNAVQEEFFHTFNSIQQVGGQIILTSDNPPEAIEKLSARLRSRFEGGLTIDIGPPDFELRCAILLIKAKQRGVELPIGLAKIIAGNTENPRKLDGVLIRVLTESKTKKVPLDEELVRNVLGKTNTENTKKSVIKPEQAIETVAAYYNLKPSQLKGNRRDRFLALPRQVLYYLLRAEMSLPLMEIGALLGGRDHTTVLHGVRKISQLCGVDKNVSADILGIKNRLFG